MNAMSIIKPISVKLQKKSSEIVKAYMDITEVINELSSVRESEDMFHSWYEQAESLAQEVGVIPEVPRVTSRQIHRDNTEHDSVEEYYRRIVVLPLLDHLIQQMKERFGKTQRIVARLINLDHVCLEDLTLFYSDDLPSIALVPTEVRWWRAKWQSENADKRPSTLHSALIKRV